jgi:hypothetical protein
VHHTNKLAKLKRLKFNSLGQIPLASTTLSLYQKMIQTTSCVKKELPNFLELLITSLNLLTMKSEHAKMKHEFDMISIEVKQNQIGIE